MANNDTNPPVLIVGAGYVGLTLAAHILKETPTPVILYDKDELKVSELSQGSYGVEEPGLDEILGDAISNNRTSFYSDLSRLIKSELRFVCVFICIDTHIANISNKVELDSLKSALTERFARLLIDLEPLINEKGFMFIRSTVPLGLTNGVCLEVYKETGRNDLKFAFVPERTAEGVAIRELSMFPQIVGPVKEQDSNDITLMLSTLKLECISTKSSSEAELAKLACNAWRDLTFAFANEVALHAAENSVDAVDAIRAANWNYPRALIPKVGLTGGPCLVKDSKILNSTSKSLFAQIGTTPTFSARKLNEFVFESILNFLQKQALHPNESSIAVVGAAFKGVPKTNDYRSGLADYLISNWKIEANQIGLISPDIQRAHLPSHFRLLELEDFASLGAIVLGNDSTETINFVHTLLELHMNKRGRTLVVVDPFACLPEYKEFEIITLGKPNWNKILNPYDSHA